AVVFDQNYTLAAMPGAETSFVTPEFEVPGRTAALELAIKTDLVDNWAYFNFALINSDNGTAYDFGREVSFYRDSDGNEGSPSSTVLIPSVAPGRYYLRVEPEMETATTARSSRTAATRRYNTVNY